MVRGILIRFAQSFFNRKKIFYFPPKLFFFFLENILWTEEFSVAGQTMSLNTYFIWQQKAFKTSFDFDPLSDALTCN